MGGGGDKGLAELSSKDIHYCYGSSTKLCHLSTHWKPFWKRVVRKRACAPTGLGMHRLTRDCGTFCSRFHDALKPPDVQGQQSQCSIHVGKPPKHHFHAIGNLEMTEESVASWNKFSIQTFIDSIVFSLILDDSAVFDAMMQRWPAFAASNASTAARRLCCLAFFEIAFQRVPFHSTALFFLT